MRKLDLLDCDRRLRLEGVVGLIGALVVVATTAAPSSSEAGEFTPGPRPVEPCRRAIHGTAGNDIISGTPRHDTICSHSGNDVVHGLGGHDSLVDDSGNDILRGGVGDDEFLDFGGDDVLIGGSGEDLFQDLAGDDVFSGQDGRDLLFIRDFVRGNDTVNGGPGRDTCARDRGDVTTSCEDKW